MKTRKDALRPIRQLIREQCASFHGGSKCHYCPDGQPTCSFFREDGSFTDHLNKGLVRCDYFETNVLPADPALESVYWGNPADGDEQASGTCKSCKKSFTKRSNRQKFCPACQKIQTAKSNRDRARKKYWSDKGRNLTV